MAHTKQSSFPALWVVILATMLLIPALMTGGRQTSAITLACVLLLAYALLYRREVLTIPRAVFAILFAFFSWIVVTTIFFSRTPYHSLRMLLVLAIGALVYCMVMNQRQKDIIAYLVIGCSAFLTLIGFIFFIQSQNYGYLRFISTFYNHNVFGGFLILPFALSLWFLWKDKEYGHIWSFSAVSLFFAAFILTFSRGTYISMAIAGALACIVFFRHAARQNILIKKILVCCAALLLGGMLAYGTFALKKIQSTRNETTISAPYEHEQIDENAISARIAYLGHALTLVREKPFTGYGLGSFAQEARRIQTDARYYSTDPHNIYAQLFAELGLVGGLLFIIFIGYHLVKGGSYAYAHPHDTLTGIYFAAFVGILAHNVIEPDFQFPSFVILFFLLAAMTIHGRNNSKQSFKTVEKHHEIANARSLRPRIAVYALICIAAILLILQSSMYFSAQAFSQAQQYAADRNHDKFIVSYRRALFFDPLSPFIKTRAAELMLEWGDTQLAQQEINASLSIHPFDQSTHLVQAKLFLAQGNTSGAYARYVTALALAPFKNIDPSAGMIAILRSEKKYKEAHNVFVALQQRFPASAFASPLWIDPHKDDIRQYMQNINAVLEKDLKNPY